jgi:hypothetical protein
MLKKLSFTVRTIALMVLFLVVMSLFTLPRLTFGYASDNSTISVIIEAIAEITVSPPSLSWSVPPCRSAGIKYLDIRNTGSLNVSQLHAYMSTLDNETIRPYGTDDPSNYAATSMIVLRNETNASMYWGGRVEWNWTEDISNKDLSGLGTGACDANADNCSWGFIRNTSYEYMWAISNGSSLLDGNEPAFCNYSNAQLALESDVDNGTVESRTPSTSGITNDGADSNWSYFSIDTPGHLLEDHCVAVSWNCSKLYIYKYDKRTASSTNFDTCANSDYVQVTNTTPYDVHTMTLDVYAPCGIPDGALSTGIIYLEAKM